jgi:hypothetical protein
MSRVLDWIYLAVFSAVLFVCWPFIRDPKKGDDDEQLR